MHEPQPAAAPVTPPRWLKGRAALAAWAELAPECHRLGLLTRLGDRLALAAGCRWWAVWLTADTALRGGLTATTAANGRQAKPQVQIAAKATDKWLAIFTRFGVTPAERARLEAPAPPAPTHGQKTKKRANSDRFFGD